MDGLRPTSPLYPINDVMQYTWSRWGTRVHRILKDGLARCRKVCYHDSMAQLIVRNLEDDVRDKLKQLAGVHGRSMEEEVRAILREAVLRASLEPQEGLGSRIAARFKECGVGPGEINEQKGQAARPAEFKP